MKKIIVVLIIVLCGSFANAQDCSQNEDLNRFMTRGKAALEIAEKPEDYKLAANEFLKALEYDAKCPDIYEQLALCYEQMGKLDPGNYQEAISYLNTYLQLRPDATNKKEIQEKIYKIEFLLEKAGGIGLDFIIGKWKFYKGHGTANDYYDIEIFKNNGNLYARYLCDYELEMMWILLKGGRGDYYRFPDNEYCSTCKDKGYYIMKEDYCNALIEYKDGIISFKGESFISWRTRAEDKITKGMSDEEVVSICGLGQTYTAETNMYQLKITDKMLKGTENCTKYESCYNGYGTVPKKCYKDCTGDCGKQEVYFVKQ